MTATECRGGVVEETVLLKDSFYVIYVVHEAEDEGNELEKQTNIRIVVCQCEL